MVHSGALPGGVNTESLNEICLPFLMYDHVNARVEHKHPSGEYPAVWLIGEHEQPSMSKSFDPDASRAINCSVDASRREPPAIKATRFPGRISTAMESEFIIRGFTKDRANIVTV